MGLKVWVQTCGVESLRANLRGGVESLHANLRGGIESLQANLRPWAHAQAFASKWRRKFTRKLERGGWKFACKLAGKVESLLANLRGGVESLRANFRWKLGKNNS